MSIIYEKRPNGAQEDKRVWVRKYGGEIMYIFDYVHQ